MVHAPSLQFMFAHITCTHIHTIPTKQFLRRVVELGLYEAGDPEIHECWERIRETYVAGGYAPATEDEDVPVASPTGVADGPDAAEGHMECV